MGDNKNMLRLRGWGFAIEPLPPCATKCPSKPQNKGIQISSSSFHTSSSKNIFFRWSRSSFSFTSLLPIVWLIFSITSFTPRSSFSSCSSISLISSSPTSSDYSITTGATWGFFE